LSNIKMISRMKVKVLIFSLLALSAFAFALSEYPSQGGGDPWTAQQLLNPADLAQTLKNQKAPQPIVFCVGMQAVIKGSIEIGPAMVQENLDKLKQRLDKLPKDANIVVYCGCCPFSRCPNIRPAMQLLGSLKFTNFKLLNLPQNIKVDWIDHGYPMNE